MTKSLHQNVPDVGVFSRVRLQQIIANGDICGCVLGLRAAKELSPALVSGCFEDEYISAGENCHRPTAWPDSSIVRVLALPAESPGLESR